QFGFALLGEHALGVALQFGVEVLDVLEEEESGGGGVDVPGFALEAVEGGAETAEVAVGRGEVGDDAGTVETEGRVDRLGEGGHEDELGGVLGGGGAGAVDLLGDGGAALAG